MCTLTAINNSMNFKGLISKVGYYMHLRYLMTWGLTTGIAFFRVSACNRILAEESMDNTLRELARGHTTGINDKFVYS